MPECNWKYLAIDPGLTTGWAAFDEQGNLCNLGRIRGYDSFLDWLEDQDPFPSEVILETYRNRPGFTNAWSTGPTQQHIGAIKRILRKRKAKLHEQEPSPCLEIGLKWAGLWKESYKKPSAHIPDQDSAIAHGTYFLVGKGIKKHRLDKT